MNSIVAMWGKHGTKLLGTASATVSGFIAISGLIPADNVKYWLAANVVLGALTVQRGYTNQATQAKLYTPPTEGGSQ